MIKKMHKTIKLQKYSLVIYLYTKIGYELKEQKKKKKNKEIRINPIKGIATRIVGS